MVNGDDRQMVYLKLPFFREVSNNGLKKVFKDMNSNVKVKVVYYIRLTIDSIKRKSFCLSQNFIQS